MHAALRPVHARRHVLRYVPDRRIVLAHEWHDVLDRVGVGRREVDVATPHPRRRLLRHVRTNRGRLWVVDDDHVPAALDLLGVHLVVALVDRPFLLAQRVRVPLQRVVQPLGRVVELLASEQHLPVGGDPDVVHERDQRVEDLGDAAAERGCGQVEHAQALEILGELADLLNQWSSGQVGVVREALVAYGYRRQHSAPDYPVSVRYLTSRVWPPLKSASSTVASMIARLSSCSEAATGPAGPSRSIMSRSSARWKEKLSRLSSSRSFAASVMASFRSATSSGESGVSRHTADSASRASTR